MQRSAASASNRAPSASSPLPANFPQSPHEDSAKRQKLSSSIPQSPDPAALTPRSLYQSDDPTTPLPQGMGKAFTQCYGGNEAETPWILNTSSSTGTHEAPSSPVEDTSPPDGVIGRRTFGNFKKKTTEISAADRSKDDGSLSSGDLDEDYEQHGERMQRRTTQNGEKPRGKRRQDQDDDRMDKIKLKKMRSGGISASSGMRQSGFAGKKYKDKRKG
jgi:hypothetical protein